MRPILHEELWCSNVPIPGSHHHFERKRPSISLVLASTLRRHRAAITAGGLQSLPRPYGCVRGLIKLCDEAHSPRRALVLNVPIPGSHHHFERKRPSISLVLASTLRRHRAAITAGGLQSL